MGDVLVVIYVKYSKKNTLAWISVIVSKATLPPTRAPNNTPALAQEWAVWSKPTLDLMHVTLTARRK